MCIRDRLWKGDGSHITEIHLIGYKINNGSLSNLTPLQKIAVNIISNEILKWKFVNKPFAII